MWLQFIIGVGSCWDIMFMTNCFSQWRWVANACSMKTVMVATTWTKVISKVIIWWIFMGYIACYLLFQPVVFSDVIGIVWCNKTRCTYYSRALLFADLMTCMKKLWKKSLLIILHHLSQIRADLCSRRLDSIFSLSTTPPQYVSALALSNSDKNTDLLKHSSATIACTGWSKKMAQS